MSKELISAEVQLKAQFYDVDTMRVVWHGNYVKYMEEARCALLDKIGFNYDEMEQAGYAWPVVGIQLKYVRTIKFGQDFVVKASLIEYENRLRIKYLFSDPFTGQKITVAESTQMAVDMNKGESLLASPKCLIKAVEAHLDISKVSV